MKHLGTIASVLLGVLFWGIQGLAAPIPSSAPSRPAKGTRSMGKALMVLSQKHKATSKELLNAVTSQLSDAPVAFVSQWVRDLPDALPDKLELAKKLAGKDSVVAVFWCELTGAHGYVYVAEPGTGRVLVRRLTGGTGSAQVEAAAIIVRASVMAFLREGRARHQGSGTKGKDSDSNGRKGSSSGQKTGDTNAKARESKKKQKGKAIKGPRKGSTGLSAEGVGPGALVKGKAAGEDEASDNYLRLGLEMGYAYDTYSTEHPEVHGLWLGLALRFWRGWWVYGGYRLSLPMQVEDSRLEATMVRHPASLGVRWIRTLDRWSLGIAGALVVDYLTHKTRAETGVEPSDDQGDLVFSMATLFVVGVRLYGRLRLMAGLGVELGLNTQRYYLDVFGDKDVLMEPWPLRPRGSLSLAVDVF